MGIPLLSKQHYDFISDLADFGDGGGKVVHQNGKRQGVATGPDVAGQGADVRCSTGFGDDVHVRGKRGEGVASGGKNGVIP